MTIQEKTQLVNLLQKYQHEQIETQMENIEIVKNTRSQGKRKWECNIKYGCKAQYEHARILTTKISREINNELPSYWQI